jgi:ubiquinone biosynthesis protein COQ9
MIAPPERSPERDAAIAALLPLVPTEGWTVRALLHAAGPDADLLFPRGTGDMIEAYVDLADRRMVEAAPAGWTGVRLPDRVRTLIALRLAAARPHKEAVRRAVAWLALPGHGVLAARCTARTVDTIWYAVGDRSADFSWYTKRAILASIYTATLLYWLRDDSEDDEATLAFLDRRLADVGRIGRLRRRIESRCRPAAA